jgi:RHS repeat-associated protein
LTSAGYVYDDLGRNTYIPAIDAPANNAGISLAYNLVDQVTGITQSGSTTSFTYDALGRRINETAGGLTTVRHYGDSSDSPGWSSKLSGSNLTTDVYTGSLGSGLTVTSTIKGTVKTASMQLTNLRGHVVTTLDLDSNAVSGWSIYDSFGNPQTSLTSDTLINYSSYGQQERATNTTGLILMGARVYNPETNQFTSKDPIKGGNENSYTYPNDPINGSDFSGLNGWIDLGVLIVGALVTSAICAGTFGVGCLVGAIAVGAVGGFVQAGVKIKEEKIPKNKIWETLGRGTLKGAFEGAVGFGLGKIVGKLVDKVAKVKIKDKSEFSKWKIDISSGIVIGSGFQYGPEVIKTIRNHYSSKKR